MRPGTFHSLVIHDKVQGTLISPEAQPLQLTQPAGALLTEVVPDVGILHPANYGQTREIERIHIPSALQPRPTR
jgi:hypothetical protein